MPKDLATKRNLPKVVIPIQRQDGGPFDTKDPGKKVSPPALKKGK